MDRPIESPSTRTHIDPSDARRRRTAAFARTADGAHPGERSARMSVAGGPVDEPCVAQLLEIRDDVGFELLA